MTVCIAAICQRNGYPMIVGATDCMTTVGDIEYERPKGKFTDLSEEPPIAALFAGDPGAQAEICSIVEMRKPTSVRGAVDLYCQQLAAFNRKQIERRVLGPLGLDMRRFIDRQKVFTGRFLHRILSEVESESADIQTIICGVDDQGPHIYTVEGNGRAINHDGLGFSAIGMGLKHAAAEFMFDQYTWDATDAHAILLTYTAKKRAELAPGVGRETAMFFLAPGYPLTPFSSGVLAALDAVYQWADASEANITAQANEKIAEFVKILHESGEETDKPEPQQVEKSDEPAPETKAPKKGGRKRAQD